MPNPNICYVVFEADQTKRYAYWCGSLAPKAEDFVVVLIGGDRNRKKIVRCVEVTTQPDVKANATIFGIVQEQPK